MRWAGGRVGAGEPFDDTVVGLVDLTYDSMKYGEQPGWSMDPSLTGFFPTVAFDRTAGTVRVGRMAPVPLGFAAKGALDWSGDVRVQLAWLSRSNEDFFVEVVVLLDDRVVMKHWHRSFAWRDRTRYPFVTSRDPRQLWRVADQPRAYQGDGKWLVTPAVPFEFPPLRRVEDQCAPPGATPCKANEVCQDASPVTNDPLAEVCHATFDECLLEPCGWEEACVDVDVARANTVECFVDLTGRWEGPTGYLDLSRNGGDTFVGAGGKVVVTPKKAARGFIWEDVEAKTKTNATYVSGTLVVGDGAEAVRWTRLGEREVVMLEWLKAECPAEGAQRTALQQQVRDAVERSLRARRVRVTVVCGSVTAVVVIEGAQDAVGAVAVAVEREVRENAEKYPELARLGAPQERAGGKGERRECHGEHATTTRKDHRGLCHAVECEEGYAVGVDGAARCVAIPPLSGMYLFRGEDNTTAAVRFAPKRSSPLLLAVEPVASPGTPWWEVVLELQSGARWVVRVGDVRGGRHGVSSEAVVDAAGTVAVEGTGVFAREWSTLVVRLNTTEGSQGTFRLTVTSPSGYSRAVVVESPRPGMHVVNVAWEAVYGMTGLTMTFEQESGGSAPWKLYSVDVLEHAGYARWFPSGTAKAIDRWASGSPADFPHTEDEMAAKGGHWVRSSPVTYLRPANYTLLLPP
eukprot:Sspe_Gene.10722::Locus_3591_Transcript_3_3_Confidence_0.500_Length_5983::g.10722::m.10722